MKVLSGCKVHISILVSLSLHSFLAPHCFWEGLGLEQTYHSSIYSRVWKVYAGFRHQFKHSSPAIVLMLWVAMKLWLCLYSAQTIDNPGHVHQINRVTVKRQLFRRHDNCTTTMHKTSGGADKKWFTVFLSTWTAGWLDRCKVAAPVGAWLWGTRRNYKLFAVNWPSAKGKMKNNSRAS